jgi:hypothetical protein
MHSRRSCWRLPFAAALLAAGALAGCSLDPTFSEINDKVLGPRCSAPTCHDSIDHKADLDLETDPYADLVDVMAMGDLTANPPSSPVDRVRVIPGDPDNSFLIIKLEGDQESNEGVRMPNRGAHLRRYEIDAIREWILEGALNN